MSHLLRRATRTMAKETSTSNEDLVSLPHPRSTIHLLSTCECLACKEQLLGDGEALRGEKVASCLASIRDLVRGLNVEVQHSTRVLENF